MVVVFDLDDTLYDEVDFVVSGFRAVAELVAPGRPAAVLEFMLERFAAAGSGRIFDDVIEAFELPHEVPVLVEAYRLHDPDITMPPERRELLDVLHDRCTLGLITDGDYTTQRNKFDRLGLGGLIDAPIFTARLAAPKPAPPAFEAMMQRFSGERDFTYVGDNPAKDFVAPRALGWQTLRFRNPRGIYRGLDGVSDHEFECFAELSAFLAG